MPRFGGRDKRQCAIRACLICLDVWLQEITLQYNLCNEPWLKYTMTAVSDRGLKPGQWTSARLHSEVLYLETQRQCFELSRVDASASSGNDAAPVSTPPSCAFCYQGCLAQNETAMQWSNAEMHYSYMDRDCACLCLWQRAHSSCPCSCL